mmetsp:Transcript_22017/g.45892  ORF Transcript_22017/g.45892 Transcript_22017/m.45892 type:complete len:280 (-) Transcript_22017:207-1046(-)
MRLPNLHRKVLLVSRVSHPQIHLPRPHRQALQIPQRWDQRPLVRRWRFAQPLCPLARPQNLHRILHRAHQLSHRPWNLHPHLLNHPQMDHRNLQHLNLQLCRHNPLPPHQQRLQRNRQLIHQPCLLRQILQRVLLCLRRQLRQPNSQRNFHPVRRRLAQQVCQVQLPQRHFQLPRFFQHFLQLVLPQRVQLPRRVQIPPAFQAPSPVLLLVKHLRICRLPLHQETRHPLLLKRQRDHQAHRLVILPPVVRAIRHQVNPQIPQLWHLRRLLPTVHPIRQQ